jgi:hypothetical protein
LNSPLSTISTYIFDQQLENSLATDDYHVCIALLNNLGRSLHQSSSKTVSLSLYYFGKQPRGTAGNLNTNSKQYTGVSGGSIAGAVIGSLIACCCVVCIATIGVIIGVTVATLKKKPVVAKLQQVSYPVYDVPQSPSSTIESTNAQPVENDPQYVIEMNDIVPQETQETQITEDQSDDNQQQDAVQTTDALN